MRRGGSMVVLVAGITLVGCSSDPGVTAVGSAAVVEEPDVVLPVDPATRLLTLDNGLTVYLRENNRPGGSAEMRLVVNAGSAMEDDDQAGVAHFLEHMLFNGTEQFPGNELVDVLRGFGMEFGADVNAYTSYDETVYELHVPVDEPDNLSTGVDVLAEWLSAATIDPDEVVAERGVVLDEWRVRDQTREGRLYQALAGLFLDGSAYEGRQPIGTEAAIEDMTAEPLRRFYDAWYRPDNAAVVVVGDIDLDEVEELVRARFEGMEPRAEQPERPDLTMRRFDTARVVILPDPDTTEAAAELTWPIPAPDGDGLRSRRAALALLLGFETLATRLEDDVTRGEADFRYATSSNNDFVRGLRAPSAFVTADVEEATAAVTALVEEFERVRRHGFADNEVDRVKAAIEASVQAEFDASETRQDRDLADSFVEHFLAGEMIPTPEDDYESRMQMLADITVEEVEAAFDAHLAASAPYLYVTVPASDVNSDDVPTVTALQVLVEGMADLEVEPREATAAVGDLLMEAPQPVEEVATSEIADMPWTFLSAQRYDFANGVTVVLNPTDISDNEVQIAVHSVGGSSLLEPQDAVAAGYATVVAATSGLGDLDAVQVATVLDGSTVALEPYIDLSEEGIWGGFATDDLELALQLVHLWFTAPRFDEAALEAAKDGDRPFIDDPFSDPDFASWLTLSAARYGDDPRFAVVPTGAGLDALTADDMERIFRDRFSGGDWVIAISGDFDPEVGEDLVRRYIGTLDGGAGEEEFIDPTPPAPTGIVEREVKAGTGEQASLALSFEAPSADTDHDQILADLLTNVLDTRLTDRIREELGASYSPYAQVFVDAPREIVEVYVSVSGDPSGMDDLVDAVRAELADVADNGPSVQEFEGAMAAMDEQYQLYGNGMMAWATVRMAREPGYLDTFLGLYDDLLAIDARELAAFAADVLPQDRFIQVVQLPR